MKNNTIIRTVPTKKKLFSIRNTFGITKKGPTFWPQVATETRK